MFGLTEKFVKKKKILTACFFVFCVFFLNSCSKKDSAGQSKKTEAEKVCTVNAQKKFFIDELETFGTVTWKLKNDVTSLVKGTIKTFTVKEGDFVKKGEVIARLRNVQLEIQKKQYETNLNSQKASFDLALAEYEQAVLTVESRLLSLEKQELNLKQKKIELELKKKEFENQLELHKIGGVTKASIEQQKISLDSAVTEVEILEKEIEIASLGLKKEDLLKNGIVAAENEEVLKKQIVDFNVRTYRASMQVAQSNVEIARQQLDGVNTYIEELCIRSPADGIVGEKYFENGEYVQENEKLATIIGVDSIFVVVNVQEKDMVNLKNKTTVFVEIPSLNEKFESEITEVSPIADFQSGNFTVRIELKNENLALKPGMFARCRIEKLSPAEYVCVPENVLLSDRNGNEKLFCFVNGFAVQKEILVKQRKAGCVWIEKGLTEGEEVICNPPVFFRDGQSVVREQPMHAVTSVHAEHNL